MKQFNFIYIFYLSLILFSISCARIGSPTGGEKDKEPPKIVFSSPENFSTNFKAKRIRIGFDEYIQLKDLNTNLLITPPIKNKPKISPTGSAGKEIRIEFKDSLQKNTTYIFNFGQSIVDFNEGNKFGNFQYVFSTGAKIDSLELKGNVKAVHFDKKPEKIQVGLYKLDNFNDSIVFREPPYYVAFTDKNGNFKFQHLSKGKYKIIALNDLDNNYVYKQSKEAIGFISKNIGIPNDTLINMSLFKEVEKFSLENINQKSRNHIQLTFKGKEDSISVKGLSKIEKEIVIINPKKIDYWYTSPSDSIVIEFKKGTYSKTKKYKRLDSKDSLILSTNKRLNINPLDTLFITSNIPIVSIDTKKASLLRDSVPVKFSFSQTKKFNYIVNFDKKNASKYQLQILPDAVTDFIGNKNKDTLSVNFSIPPKSKYGNLVLEIPNINDDYFIEILDSNNRVVRKSKTSKSGNLKFDFLKPGKYYIRLIWDKNKNNYWDTGNYLLHKQAEKTLTINKVIEIRANWDVNQKLDVMPKG